MDSSYQSVDEKPAQSDNRYSKKWLRGIATNVICLLWLGPIITLLYLNFSKYIIGPSVWCLLGKCSIYDGDARYLAAKISRNDRNDHNTNGMLLFAAKCLEVWFVFVAGLLVYDAQKALRRSNGGLPHDYTLTHLEFSDSLNLFHVSKWTLPIRTASRSPKHRRQVCSLSAFVLLACFLTILVNLMGPSTGVLILPSVQSIDQPHNASELFVQLESHEPPAPIPGHGLVGCDADQLKSHLYSCAEYVRGSELDSMSSFVAAPMRNDEETRNETGLVYLAESQEDNVHFLAFNFTYAGKGHEGNYFNDFIVPNRQTLRMVSADTDRVITDTQLVSKIFMF